MTYGNEPADKIGQREFDKKINHDLRFMTWNTYCRQADECIELKCSHFDGDMCMRGDCDKEEDDNS